MRKWLLLSLLVVLSGLPLWVDQSFAQSTICPASGMNVLATNQVGRKVTIQFSICDANGVAISTVQPSAVRLIEDEQVVLNPVFQTFLADQREPIQVSLANGGSTVLSAVGASIGIVFDATQLLNGSGTDVRDNIGAGRVVIEAFLLEPGDPPPVRTVALGDPERVGLFIPTDQPDQSLRPNDLPDFTADRYAVVNTLRVGLPIRQGKTNLFAAVQAAIEATARDAQRRGAQAIVVVVSDGGDAISGDALNTIVARAVQAQVKILAIGVGSDRALQTNGFRLQQLAEATGGRYLQRPSEQAVAELFTQFVTAQPVAMYEVSYETAVLDDGRAHSVRLEVTTANGTLTYAMPVNPGNAGQSGQLRPVWEELVRGYLLFAVPSLVIITLIVIGIFAMGRSGLNEKTLSTR
jgi:hypothetical protein